MAYCASFLKAKKGLDLGAEKTGAPRGIRPKTGAFKKTGFWRFSKKPNPGRS